MRVFEQLRAIIGTKGWLTEQSRLWARQHYPGPQERLAALAAGIIIDQVGVRFEQLHSGCRFVDDLGMDDLEGVELVMAVEEALGLKIPDEEAEQIETLDALVSYLHARVPAEVA